MSIAPIFLVWDESISHELGSRIRADLDSVLNEISSQSAVEILSSFECFAADGKSLISIATLSPYRSEIFDRIKSGVGGDSLLIRRLEIERYIKERVPSNRQNELLPPIVLVFASRPWSNGFDSNRFVSELLDQQLRPRLIVFDSSRQFSWLANMTDADKSKRARNVSLNSDWTEVSQQLRSVGDWILSKASERKQVLPQNEIQQTEGDTSSRSLKPQSISAQNEPTASRPTIKLHDEEPSIQSMEVKSESLSSSPTPSVPLVDVVSEETEVSTQKVRALPQDVPNVPGTPPRLVATEDLAGDYPQVTGSNLPAPPTLPPPQKRKVRSSRRLSRSGQRERKIIRPRSANRRNRNSPNQQSTLAPFAPGPEIEVPIEITSPTPPPPQNVNMAADGQIIVDKGSSINAKKWFHPDWKKLPKNGPSRDLEIEFGSINELRIFAGSTRGTKHQYYGDENQDAFFVSQTSDSKYIAIAVCDGVGSAQFSAYGSKTLSFLVAKGITNRLESDSFDEANIRHIVTKSVKDASDRMQQWNLSELYAPNDLPNSRSLSDVSSTLCVAVVSASKSESGTRKIWLACVGDSPCYTLKSGAWSLRSTATKDGEVLEHGTQALPVMIGDEPNLEWFEFALEDSEVMMLVTDGIGTSMADGETTLGKWFAKRLWATQVDDFFNMMSPNELISTLTFDRQSEDDDRTMVVLFDYEGVIRAIKAAEQLALLPPPTSEGASVSQ